tara:strand:+ start:210 stop:740 length:531 start_codon:yes stop_codon:yes gene_type:complete
MKYLEKEVKHLARLYESHFTNKSLIKKLIKDIDEGVGNLNYQTNVKAQMTPFNYFDTNKNFLQFINEIKPEFEKQITDRLQIALKLKEAWGIKMQGKQDHVIAHNHDHSRNTISGILYLTSSGPGTYFPELDYKVKENKGKFVLFNSFLMHSVEQSYLKTNRYTIAFNFEEHTEWK